MSAEYTRGNSESGTVATAHAAPLAPSQLRPALFVTGLIILVAGLLLVRPVAGAYYLSAGGRAIEAARTGLDPAPHLDRAARALEQARALSQREPLVYRRIAEVALLRGRPDDAVAALEAALRLAPESLLIRRELLYAYIDAQRLNEASPLLRELRGDTADLMAVADADIRAGALDRALATYNGLIAMSAQPRPELLVRAGLTAAALGDITQASRLLRASGAPEPLDLILASVVPSTSDVGVLAPPELQVDHRQQEIAAPSLLAFFGAGWYPYEQGFGRWAGPTAQLLVFSPEQREVGLTLAIHTLHDPASDTLMGDVGTLEATVNGGPTVAAHAQTGSLTLIPLDLPAGWSSVELRLASGSFRPAALTPGSGDQRDLSFAIVAATVLP